MKAKEANAYSTVENRIMNKLPIPWHIIEPIFQEFISVEIFSPYEIRYKTQAILKEQSKSW